MLPVVLFTCQAQKRNRKEADGLSDRVIAPWESDIASRRSLITNVGAASHEGGKGKNSYTGTLLFLPLRGQRGSYMRVSPGQGARREEN